MNTIQKLFTPLQLGAIEIKHRVVMAPLTRSRAIQPNSIPGDLMATYYAQRASDGGFIISEATNISVTSRGWLGAPGLYSTEQVEGWRRVVAEVRAKGGHMFAQLWHTGRSSHVSMTGGETPVSASVDPAYWQDASRVVSTPGGWVGPSPHRALTVAQIAAIVEDYLRASQRAMDAGFEGVELHAANGYLVDQFLQDGSNKRTDEYGGTVENRSRFLLEVTAAMASVWGANRVAVRIGPGNKFNGMSDTNPQALFTYLAKSLNRLGLAYLHIVEPRITGSELTAEGQGAIASEWLRPWFQGKIIAAGGFEPDTAEAALQHGTADAVAFGRHFIANPDLPRRIFEGLPLAKYDRGTFYTFTAKGYTDYPKYEAKRKTTMTNGINIMLVHGAWADGSCWSKVIPLLIEKGFEVTAAQIPLTSLKDDIAVTRRLLAMQTKPTVLVGHSYGGAVITGAATETPHVKALVYITGFGLDEGESLASLSKQGPPSPGSAAIRPDRSGFLWIDREGFRQAFVADATPAEAALMAIVQKPLSVASFTDPEGTPAWKTIPSWYLISTEDHMIPPPAQELMAKRMGATIRSVPASHASFMAHPQEVAAIIELAAASLPKAKSAAE